MRLFGFGASLIPAARTPSESENQEGLISQPFCRVAKERDQILTWIKQLTGPCLAWGGDGEAGGDARVSSVFRNRTYEVLW